MPRAFAFDLETLGFPRKGARKRTLQDVMDTFDKFPVVLTLGYAVYELADGAPSYENISQVYVPHKQPLKPFHFQSSWRAVQVHGIDYNKWKTNTTLKMAEFMDLLDRTLGKCDCVLGYNVMFDVTALTAHLIKNGGARGHRIARDMWDKDVVDPAKTLRVGARHPRLQEAYAQHVSGRPGYAGPDLLWHDARDDTYAAARLHAALQNDEKDSVLVVDICEQPQLQQPVENPVSTPVTLVDPADDGDSSSDGYTDADSTGVLATATGVRVDDIAARAGDAVVLLDGPCLDESGPFPTLATTPAYRAAALEPFSALKQPRPPPKRQHTEKFVKIRAEIARALVSSPSIKEATRKCLERVLANLDGNSRVSVTALYGLSDTRVERLITDHEDSVTLFEPDAEDYEWLAQEIG